MLIVGGRRRGRPPRAETPSTVHVEFRITESEKAALVRMAEYERIPIATAIREAVNSYVGDWGERVIFQPSGDRFPKPKS